MKTSEAINEIIPAIIAFQAEVQPAPKDSTNPHFKSTYADLTSVWEAVRPVLAKHHLAVVQAPSYADGRIVLTTRIFHKSGQWIESELSVKPQQDTAQAIGSCITYERRYVLAAMLGVVADEDDDGNEGSKPKSASVQQPKPQNALFSSSNSAQVEKLEAYLIAQKISQDVWQEIFTSLEGKDPKIHLGPMIKKIKEG
jgi:hypothetical protein